MRTLSNGKYFIIDYFDDFFVLSERFSEDLLHIKTELSILKETGLTIKTSKIYLACSKITFSGHTLEQGKV